MMLHISGPVGHSLKILVVLHEKGAQPERRVYDLLKLEHRVPEVTRLSARGSLPILVENAGILDESSAIEEYLDDILPGPALMSADPVERWQVRTWFKFVNEDLAPAVGILAWQHLTRPRLTRGQRNRLAAGVARIELPERREWWEEALAGFSADRIDTARTKVEGLLDLAEAQLDKSAWLAGESYSLADIDCFPFLHVLRDLPGGALTEHERVREWLARADQRLAVKAALGEPGPRDWVPGPELIRWG